MEKYGRVTQLQARMILSFAQGLYASVLIMQI
jgi:hypothetical protein